MHQNLRCPKCNHLFGCSAGSCRVVGPVLEINCPFCGKKSQRNMSAFIESQVDDSLRVLEKARLMLGLARNMAGILEPVVGDKKKKKK